MTRALTPELVTQIRTAGLTDTEWARRLNISARAVRDARVGNTHPDVQTPPDTAPREGNGRGQNSIAKPARQRGSYFRE